MKKTIILFIILKISIVGYSQILTTVTDNDGNVYHTVRIGTQVWFKENLNTTHYSNGEAIPYITNGDEWRNLETGAYCNYNNKLSYIITYGRIYNWNTVVDSRRLCPIGWHVPNNSEWEILTKYLGGESVAGGKLKETGLAHWENINVGATNETGFSAVPGGYRIVSGAYMFIGAVCYWWSSTELNTSYSWYRAIRSDSEYIFKGNGDGDKRYGFYVRCLRD